MGRNAMFSISEEACAELESFFGDTVDEAAEEILSVFSELMGMNAEAKYKLVIQHTKEFAEYYGEDFSNEVKRLYEEWCEEGESIHQFMLDLEAGEDDDDDSVAAARELEENMRERLEDALSKEPELYEGDTTNSLSEYGGSEKLFEDIADVLKRFEDRMEDMMDDVKQTAESNGEDNQLYENIGGILSAILEACRSFFGQFREGISGQLSEHVSDQDEVAMSKVEEDKETFSGKAEEIGESLKDLASLFQF